MKNTLPKVTISKGVHHNEQQLFIGFAFNKELIVLVRTIYGARWSASKKTSKITRKRAIASFIY